MNALFILAQAATTVAESSGEQLIPVAQGVDFIWKEIESLKWLQAVVVVSFGAVYMLYGWRIFKVLAVISFAMIGMCIGMYAGEMLGSQVWGGILGFVVLAILSVPLMRWVICLLGAAAGGVITAGIWYAMGLPVDYIWAGGIIGLVAGGMLSFIIFKASVMLFTSLGGSSFVMIGLLALLYSYEVHITGGGEATGQIEELVKQQQWFLPLALMIPTAIGVLIQNKMIRHSAKWEVE